MNQLGNLTRISEKYAKVPLGEIKVDDEKKPLTTEKSKSEKYAKKAVQIVQYMRDKKGQAKTEFKDVLDNLVENEGIATGAYAEAEEHVSA